MAMRKPKTKLVKKIPFDEFRLCYVDGNLMYFTDNFEGQWGDDWDDAPYECNAETPYRCLNDIDNNDGRGHILVAAWYDVHGDVSLPCDGVLNSSYSVQDINAGAVAWLYKRGKGGLNGGTTLADTRAFCKKHDICFAVFDNQDPFDENR